MNIGANIRRFRRQLNLEQKDLATILQVSNKTISSWETNRTEPKMEMIDKMCTIFGCRRSDFLQDYSTDYTVEDNNAQYIFECYSRAPEKDRKMVDSILYKYSDEFRELLKQMDETSKKTERMENEYDQSKRSSQGEN